MDIRKRSGLLWIALGTIALTGCPKEQPADNTGGGGRQTNGGSTKQYTIAFIPKGQANQFWVAMKAGAEVSAKEENCKLEWVAPNPEGDMTAQVNLMQNKITSKVDGIVLAATESNALITPVKDAISKGIPVVTVDSGIASDDAVAYIATDNVKGGIAAADELAKLMGDKGKVGLLTFLKGAVSSDEREQGFKEGLKKHPNMTLVTQLQSGDPNLAFNNTTNMLTAHSDIGGIFASSEPNGVGASQVLDQKKLAGKVKLVAYDSSDKELEELNKGTIQALIVQDPYQMGYKGVKTVLMAIKKQPIADKKVDSGMTVVTKDNLSDPRVDKLLHPK